MFVSSDSVSRFLAAATAVLAIIGCEAKERLGAATPSSSCTSRAAAGLEIELPSASDRWMNEVELSSFNGIDDFWTKLPNVIDAKMVFDGDFVGMDNVRSFPVEADGGDLMGVAHVFNNFLDDGEIEYYRAAARRARQADHKMIGRYSAPTVLPVDLVVRMESVLYGQKEAVRRNENRTLPILTQVSKIVRPVQLHEDIRADTGEEMTDYTALVSLTDSPDNYLAWGDGYRVPFTPGSLMVFRGSSTHGIPLLPNTEVDFLGPFGLRDFKEIGYGCQGATIRCGDKTLVRSDECAFIVDIECESDGNIMGIGVEEGFDNGAICFECSSEGFQFFNLNTFNARDGTDCRFDQELTDTPNLEVACSDTEKNKVKLEITEFDQQTSSKKSKKKSGKFDDVVGVEGIIDEPLRCEVEINNNDD